MAIDWLRMEVNNGERPENVRLAYEVDQDDIKVHMLESWEKWLFNVLYIFVPFYFHELYDWYLGIFCPCFLIKRNKIYVHTFI